MGFKGLSNAVTNTHPLLPSMGTTRQKSSCRNRLQNGPHSLLRMKVGVHTRLRQQDRTQRLTRRNTGRFGWGRYHYPRSVLRGSETLRGRVSERQTLPLLGLGRVCSRRTQRACGTAMRLCVSLSRGVAAPLGCVPLWQVWLVRPVANTPAVWYAKTDKSEFVEVFFRHEMSILRRRNATGKIAHPWRKLFCSYWLQNADALYEKKY